VTSTVGGAKGNPCTTCGDCCRSYLVTLCGHDIWLISTHLRLAPEAFVVAIPQRVPGRDGFRLAAGEPTYGLALDKRGRFRAKAPCVFLVQLGDGGVRCGIHAHRPVVCRAYPMAAWSDVVFQRPETLCPPDSWPMPEVNRPSWRQALRRQRLHFDVYDEVVERWNARVAARPERGFQLGEYLAYVLNVYDRLAALDRQLGSPALLDVEAGWPMPPRGVGRQTDPAPGEDTPPWLDYMRRVRRVVDDYRPAGARERPPASVSSYGPVGESRDVPAEAQTSGNR
jgi:Fe-S-cluster containining protein